MNDQLAQARAREAEAIRWLDDELVVRACSGVEKRPVRPSRETDLFTREMVVAAYVAGRDQTDEGSGYHGDTARMSPSDFPTLYDPPPCQEPSALKVNVGPIQDPEEAEALRSMAGESSDEERGQKVLAGDRVALALDVLENFGRGKGPLTQSDALRISQTIQDLQHDGDPIEVPPTPFAISTADPRFDPRGPVTINGYRYIPANGPLS